MTTRDSKKKTSRGMTGFEALCMAHQITCYPFIFQAVICLDRFGIFQALDDAEDGLTKDELCQKIHLNSYAIGVLLETAYRFKLLEKRGDKYILGKVAYFLIHDEMVRVNLNFAEDVCYKGLYALPESLKQNKPLGLKEIGQWKDIYHGLSLMPGQAQRSWFDFDHFYSDQSTDEALNVLSRRSPREICDVGGNTGNFEIACCKKLKDVSITVVDLPGQCEIIKDNVAKAGFKERVKVFPYDLLSNLPFPDVRADTWWISQVLECFSEEQVEKILGKIAQRLRDEDRVYILEPLIGSQPFETGDQCLSAFSLYFTAIANGTSCFRSKEDMVGLISKSGLNIEEIIDGLGTGHSLIICKKK